MVGLVELYIGIGVDESMVDVDVVVNPVAEKVGNVRS